MKHVFTRIMKLPFMLHLAALPLLFMALTWVKGVLDASYIRSNFPVDYMTGQTSFSGSAIKNWYQAMIEQGTLDIYWQTQLIDFGFIASVLALGLMFGTFMARIAMQGGWGYKTGMLAANFIPLGALCDVAENLLSFIMLSMPINFPDLIALPYSGFAVAKFGLLTLGMLMLVVSLLVNLGERTLNWFKQPKSSHKPS